MSKADLIPRLANCVAQVLIFDDNEDYRFLLNHHTQRLGLGPAFEASSAATATEIFITNAATIKTVIIDF